MRASLVGFEPGEAAVTLSAGQTARVTLALVPSALGEVVVRGRAGSLVGDARAASQGVVGPAELALRPLLRVGEVLETIPGTIVTQHSGSGKANQFFLRGFNLDHGTDFAASVEGVPQNLPTHAHGQGYLDLNHLIPELIESVAFEKGPLDASAGDFATAGRAQIAYARRLDRDLVKAEAGIDGYYHGLAAGSRRVAGGELLVGARGRLYDGPWVMPENSALASGIAKYSRGTRANGLELTALGYAQTWDATDQVARRAVESGLIDRLGNLDDSNGGTTSRFTLSGAYTTTSAAAAQTRVQAYAAAYRLNLFSNFTYFLDDPERGDQFEQADRRVYAGGSVSHRRPTPAFGVASTTTVGAQFCHDAIGQVGLFKTQRRERFDTVRDDDVDETTLGVWARNEARPAGWLRTTLGLRADLYRFDVDADVDANSGTETAALVSPKAGVAVGPWRQTEVYASAGLGFHSNDARGTTITVDPQSGEAVERVDPLVRTRGAEVGVRTEALSGVRSALALWAIGLDSELLFVGDAGGTEASDASRHVGVEWTNHVQAADGLALTLDVALTDARFRDVPEGEDRIENSIGRIVSAGAYAGRLDADGPLAALQLRHFGPRPLDASGSETADATTLVNAKLGYRLGPVAVSLDVLNALDSRDADVSYFYASRLRGEPADGVEDVHVHPVVPRTARLTMQVRL